MSDAATFSAVVSATADELVVPWKLVVDPDCQWYEAQAARRVVAIVLIAEFGWDYQRVASILGYCGDHQVRRGRCLYQSATDWDWEAALTIRNRVVAALVNA